MFNKRIIPFFFLCFLLLFASFAAARYIAPYDDRDINQTRYDPTETTGGTPVAYGNQPLVLNSLNQVLPSFGNISLLSDGNISIKKNFATSTITLGINPDANLSMLNIIDLNSGDANFVNISVSGNSFLNNAFIEGQTIIDLTSTEAFSVWQNGRALRVFNVNTINRRVEIQDNLSVLENVTTTTMDQGGIIYGIYGSLGAGSHSLKVGGGSLAGGVMITEFASDDADIWALEAGSVAQGYVAALDGDASIKATPVDGGARAFGYAESRDDRVSILASANGAVAEGYVFSGDFGGFTTLAASGKGARAEGYVESTFAGTADIIASANGSEARGHVSQDEANVSIEANGLGSFASGYARATESDTDTFIRADGYGSLALGYVIQDDSTLTTLRAAGRPSFVMGASQDGERLEALATNSGAFGRDFTNATANTWCFGYGQKDFCISSGVATVYNKLQCDTCTASGANSVALGDSSTTLAAESFALGDGLTNYNANSVLLQDLNVLGDLNAFGASSFGSGTDYADFNATGQLRLHGAARVVQTLSLPANTAKGGGTAPTAAIVGNYSVLQFSSAGGVESAFFVGHVPDDWDSTTDVSMHIHWSPTNANAGDVVWDIDYVSINPENNEVLTAATANLTVTDSTQTLQDELLETGHLTIPAANIMETGVVSIKLSRDTADGADTYNSDVSFVLIHIEYVSNKLGKAT